MTLEEKRRARYLFLKALYDATGGSTSKAVEWEDVAKKAGISKDVADNAVDYLRDEGLLQYHSRAETGITIRGVIEIERAELHPEKSTTYFPPVNENHFG